ncbi:MAG: hypothetical protein MZW92_54675 [Comamonadaceae bacterium]|nr:hypothetical protein [Comamonadaceae bacterium]
MLIGEASLKNLSRADDDRRLRRPVGAAAAWRTTSASWRWSASAWAC